VTRLVITCLTFDVGVCNVLQLIVDLWNVSFYMTWNMLPLIIDSQES